MNILNENAGILCQDDNVNILIYQFPKWWNISKINLLQQWIELKVTFIKDDYIFMWEQIIPKEMKCKIWECTLHFRYRMNFTMILSWEKDLLITFDPRI